MTQYLMRPDKKAKELIYALNNYSAERIVISAFSLGKRRSMESISSDSCSSLEFKVNSDWKFYIDKKEFIVIKPDKEQLFKLEYQDERQMRIYPHCDDPNDLRIISPVYSVFRNVVDDYLLEIWFKGKIPLIEDGAIRGTNYNYWKIKK